MVNMNECSMMGSIGYLKRIACIFESRSQNEEKIMLACMKEWMWIVLMIYRYENQVWKYVYRLRKEFWPGYILDSTYYTRRRVSVGNSMNKTCGFTSKPKPKPLGSKPKPKPMRGGSELTV
jgi:hypothetical protein